MSKKLMKICLAVFLFLGVFAVTNYSLEETPVCSQVCAAYNGVGCPLLGCGYVTATNGNKYLACYYSTRTTCQTIGEEEGGN